MNVTSVPHGGAEVVDASLRYLTSLELTGALLLLLSDTLLDGCRTRPDHTTYIRAEGKGSVPREQKGGLSGL